MFLFLHKYIHQGQRHWVKWVLIVVMTPLVILYIGYKGKFNVWPVLLVSVSVLCPILPKLLYILCSHYSKLEDAGI